MGRAVDRLQALTLGTSRTPMETIAEGMAILAQEIDKLRDEMQDHTEAPDGRHNYTRGTA